MPGARYPPGPAQIGSEDQVAQPGYFQSVWVARVWVNGQGSDAQGLRRRTWGVGHERPADVREPGGGVFQPASVQVRSPVTRGDRPRRRDTLSPWDHHFRTTISGSKRHSQPRRSIKRQRLHHSPVLAATPADSPTADPALRRGAAAQAH